MTLGLFHWISRTVGEEQRVSLHGAGAIVGYDEFAFGGRLGVGWCLGVDQVGGLEQEGERGWVGELHGL